MRLRPIQIAAAVVLVVTAGGVCTSVPTPSTSVPTPSTSEDIGVIGGALSFSGGGSVVVPPGAVSSTTRITAEQISAPADAGFNVVGPFYRFGPAGQIFDASVTVRLPLASYVGGDAGIEQLALLTVVWSDGGGWERIPSWVDNETWSVVTQVRGFSSGGAAMWGSDACATTASCPGGGSAYCLMGNLVQSSCGTSKKCLTTIIESCEPIGKRCVEGACVGGVACATNAGCEASGARYCEGTTIKQAYCPTDKRCVEEKIASCENPAAPQTCSNGACVVAATCVNDSACVDAGVAYCGEEAEAWRWQCVNGVCVPRIVEACWHAGKICSAGSCGTGAACTGNAGCPDAGARFCDDDKVVAWRCSPQSDNTSRCQRWVQESCEARGMACAAGACVVADAGAVVDAGAAADAGADAGSGVDAGMDAGMGGMPLCGCGPSDTRPDGGRLVVGDAGCSWTDATLCSGWHSIVTLQDAGLNPNGAYLSGTEFTYSVANICGIKILCP